MPLKEYKLSYQNTLYYEAFKAHIAPGSWPTYKVDIGAFLEEIGTYDFVKVTPARIQRYAAERRPVHQREQSVIHLRSMMSFLVQNDVCRAREKVSKDMVIWLLQRPRSCYKQMRLEV